MSKKKIVIIGIIICLLAAVSFFLLSGFEKGNDSFPSSAPDYNESVKTEEKETETAKKETEEVKESETPLPEIKEEKKEKEKEVLETATEKPKEEKTSEEEKMPDEEEEELPSETPMEEKEEETDEAICFLTVRCDSVLKNIDKLSESKREIIPQNGIFLSRENVSFSEGESVFDVLQRELKNSGIHFEYVKNPMYNSVYIEGIGNLYEFDMGDMSGWLYKVNSVKPTYGCSQYKIKKGDKIEFLYSCNYMEE